MPGESHAQGSLAGYSPPGHRVGHAEATQHTHMHGIGADMDTVIKWTETAPKQQHLKSR